MKYIKLNLIESQVDDKYNALYSTIDRETFDKICSIDPKTSIHDGEVVSIGNTATAFLLPAYMNGDTEFVNNIDETKEALTKFLGNRQAYPPQFRNLGAFPSVTEFVKYVKDPENSDLKLNDVSKDKNKKEAELDPITKIYNQYYVKDIPNKEDFDKIVKMDPTSTTETIGEVAKNLLLPCFIKGEKDILDKADKIEDSINQFEKEKHTYKDGKNDLHNYTSVDEFINYVSSIDSTMMSKLKHEFQEGRDYKVIAKTSTYDIVQPLCREANKVIAGGGWDVGPNGMHWCTSSLAPNFRQYWNDYATKGQWLIDFIQRGKEYGSDNRRDNYQISVYPNYRIHDFLDGNDASPLSSNRSEALVAFLVMHPEVFKAIKDKEPFVHMSEIESAKTMLDLQGDKPLVISKLTDLKIIYSSSATLRNLIKEIQIDGIDKIPNGLFANFASIKKVVIGPSIKVIGNAAFYNCNLLTELKLSEGLEVIGKDAFNNCKVISNFQLPNSVKEIQKNAFDNEAKCKIMINHNRLGDENNKLKLDSANKNWYMSHLKIN